ncbi:MAG: ABC transporter substrate-binding protein [Pseudomonadota bacterium]|nr:ABC transporter substrate-binding protein [Pseudomonadota bacterium]
MADTPARRRKRLASSTLAIFAGALVLGACGGSGSSTTVNVAEMVASTGVSAGATPFANSAVLSAEYEINAAGGILGRKVANVVVDTKSDPADGLIELNRILATHNIAMSSGPGSDVASALVPRLARAHVMIDCYCGTAAFDNTTIPYFWRLLPPDPVGGATIALYAKQRGYTRVAAVFGTDASSQGDLPGVLQGARAVGLKVVANVGLTPDQTSYRTQVEQLIAAKPQVIVTESDGPTAATFFGELKQLGGLVPVFGTNATLGAGYLKSFAPVVGAAFLRSSFRAQAPAAAAKSPGVAVYNRDVQHVANRLPSPLSQFQNNPFIEANRDALIMFALAMTAAKSTDPAVANQKVIDVTAPGPTKTRVYSYADGVAALKAGKAIQFIGASGEIKFNRYHNAFGDQSMEVVSPEGGEVGAAVIPAAQIQQSLVSGAS